MAISLSQLAAIASVKKTSFKPSVPILVTVILNTALAQIATSWLSSTGTCVAVPSVSAVFPEYFWTHIFGPGPLVTPEILILFVQIAGVVVLLFTKQLAV